MDYAMVTQLVRQLEWTPPERRIYNVDLLEDIRGEAVPIDFNLGKLSAIVLLVVSMLFIHQLSALLAPHSVEVFEPTDLLSCVSVDNNKFLCEVEKLYED